MQFDLARFDSYREGNRLEVKKAAGGLPRSMWDTYSAFANSYGGVIILGVIENEDGSWSTSGLNGEMKLAKSLWDALHDQRKVSVNLLTDKDVEILTTDTGDTIIVITVPRANRTQRPVYIDNNLFGGTYRRNGEGDYHCSRAEVLAMVRDEPEDTADMKVIEAFGLDALNEETIHSYRNRHMAYRRSHPWEKLDDTAYLERIGAAGRGADGELHPTGAGLLMFSEEYLIVQEFPEYFLDYREVLDPTIRWTDRIQSTSGEWTGNLFDFFFRVINKLVQDIKVPFALSGITRIEDTPVHRALREALLNAVVNADYYVPQGLVVVKEPGHIAIHNPGYIRTGKDQMLRGGISDPRNKALMKMFNLIGIGEHAGSGVPDIFTVWEENGWPQPSVSETFDPGRTSLILTLSTAETEQKVAEKGGRMAEKSGRKISRITQERLDTITALLASQESMSRSEIADQIGLSGARTKELLSILLENDVVQTTGAGRSLRYKKRQEKVAE